MSRTRGQDKEEVNVADTRTGQSDLVETSTTEIQRFLTEYSVALSMTCFVIAGKKFKLFPN